MLIHPEKVSGEDCGFVAACAAADFHDGVLAVVRIRRDQEELDVRFHIRDLRLELGDLFAGHLAEVLILLVQEDVLRRCEVVQSLLVLQTGLNNGLQLLVILVQLDELFHVRHRFRTRELLLQGCEFLLEGEYLFK